MIDFDANWQTAINEITVLRDNNKKIVFVSGDFNIIHPGHQRLLNGNLTAAQDAAFRESRRQYKVFNQSINH